MTQSIILCVDSDLTALNRLKAAFRIHFSDRYTIETVGNGAAALDKIKDFKDRGAEFPVILVDLNLPDLKVDAFLTAIHEVFPSTRKVLLGDRPAADILANCINNACLHHLVTKPSDPNDLLMVIEQAIERYTSDLRLKEQCRHLETMNRKMETLFRLSSLINSTLDRETVKKKAMEAIIELMAFETGSIYLIDTETGELYFEVALGDNEERIKEIRLKIGEGVAGWVAEKGTSNLVPDTRLDPRWASRVDNHSSFQTRNMITVPIRSKQRVIGVLQVINKLNGDIPNEDDRQLLEKLSDQVAIALENARLYEEHKEMFKETVEAIVTAIEKRDPYTGGHTKRVRNYCLAIARYLDLDDETREWLELAAILHDAGKIGVDDVILRKTGQLTENEFSIMKQHPSYGFEILQHIRKLQPAIPGMQRHHERFDGRGYPDGYREHDIPLIARIIAVADTWDAMTSNRPYRNAIDREDAENELRQNSGIQFDPQVVTAFFKALERDEIC